MKYGANWVFATNGESLIALSNSTYTDPISTPVINNEQAVVYILNTVMGPF